MRVNFCSRSPRTASQVQIDLLRSRKVTHSLLTVPSRIPKLGTKVG